MAVVLDRYQTHMQCLVHSTMVLAFTYQAQQRPERALVMADAIPAFLVERDNTLLLPVFHAFQAELARRQGRLADARPWLARARPEQGLMPHFFAQHLVLPKLLLALNTPDSLQTAADQLARLREFAEARHHVHVLIEVLAVQAVLFETQGDRAAALAALSRAIELAQPGGFIRLFVDLGAPLHNLLRLLPTQSVAALFVTQILAAFDPPPPIAPAASAGSPDLIEPLTQREVEILTLLEQRLSNKEIAARLFISPHTVTQHTLHIYQKLQVNTRRAAVAKAQHLDLLAGP